MLSQDQTNIIKATVPILKEYGATVTKIFYENLLRENPSLNNIFNQSNQATGHQFKALAGAVFAYAANIDNLAVLESALERICHKHASLLIKPEQYAIVGKYLLQAFGQVLGDAFTPEIEAAWAAAYGQLAQLMIDAEAKLYAEANGWTDWRQFTVKEKIQEAAEITSFVLIPVDKQPLPLHHPGQYISIMLNIPSLGHNQTRQYSLSDQPSQQSYRISVKKDSGLDATNPEAVAHPGYVSNILHQQTKVGDTVLLSHPRGDFYLNEQSQSNSPLVMISAGVGLTPMMSMLNTSLAKQSTRPLSWIHGARSTEHQAFADHIQKKNALHKNLQTTTFITDLQETDREGVDFNHVGRVDLTKCDKQQALFLADAASEYYICGPRGFMLGMQDQLKSLGVAESRIKMELFGTGGI